MLTSLDEKYDAHLAQAENLTILFVSMHDEVCLYVCIKAYYLGLGSIKQDDALLI